MLTHDSSVCHSEVNLPLCYFQTQTNGGETKKKQFYCIEDIGNEVDIQFVNNLLSLLKLFEFFLDETVIDVFVTHTNYYASIYVNTELVSSSMSRFSIIMKYIQCCDKNRTPHK